MSNWIRCKDKMPEDYVVVIGYRQRIKSFEFCSHAGAVWISDDSIIAENAITHWMPLPEPPEV